MIKVCLSHDIDRIHKSYQYITKPLKALIDGDLVLFVKRLFSPLYVRNPYWGFDKIIEIENRYGVKSTLFFLNESIKVNWLNPNTYKLALGRYKITNPKIQKMIKYLDANGWEIGVHGSYGSYKNLELLRREKKVLESIVGHPIIGIRQHYLNICDITWKFQNMAGFKYDSSWGYSSKIGFKDKKCIPFFPIAGDSFCEIPQIIMDTPFQLTPDRWKQFEMILEEIDSKDGFLVINYHNSNFNELDFPGFKISYSTMIEKLIQRNACFMTMEQAYSCIMKNYSGNGF